MLDATRPRTAPVTATRGAGETKRPRRRRIGTVAVLVAVALVSGVVGGAVGVVTTRDRSLFGHASEGSAGGQDAAAATGTGGTAAAGGH